MPDRLNTRLAGHALQHEGRPYVRRESNWVRSWYTDYGNTGVAFCECGEHSPELESDASRQRWHRDVHKPAVRGRAAAREYGWLSPIVSW